MFYYKTTKETTVPASAVVEMPGDLAKFRRRERLEGDIYHLLEQTAFCSGVVFGWDIDPDDLPRFSGLIQVRNIEGSPMPEPAEEPEQEQEQEPEQEPESEADPEPSEESEPEPGVDPGPVAEAEPEPEQGPELVPEPSDPIKQKRRRGRQK